MITGCRMCGGTVTGPVGTTLEASKRKPSVVLAFQSYRALSLTTLCTLTSVPGKENAPFKELKGIVFDAAKRVNAISHTAPVKFRIASLSQAPAPFPPVQARKDFPLTLNLNKRSKI